MQKDGIDLSEEFLYWGCKKIDGRLDDNGTTLNSAINSLKSYGQPKEEYWTYDSCCLITNNTYQPSEDAKVEALKKRIYNGNRLAISVEEVKQKLSDRYAVIIGIVLFEEFLIPSSGLVPLPQNVNKALGGHAVLIAGWDDRLWNGVFIIRNSWGESWGVNGYGFIPYQYFLNYTVDAWAYKNN